MRLPVFARLLALALVSTASAVGPARGATPAGTTVSNTVTASYADAAGDTFTTQSNTVDVTVAAVGALTVGPKEQGCNPKTDGFVIGQSFVRTFTISNTSNTSDAYTLAALTTSAGTIQSVVFVDAAGNQTPATVGSTVSQAVQPGGQLQVVVTVGATTRIAAGTDVTVTLTARTTNGTTANGTVSDSAAQCAIATPGAGLSNPGGAGIAVQKLVDGVKSVSAAGGTTVTYTIPFENFGGVAAQNVVLVDTVPVGITADPGTVRINGTLSPATLNGATLSVPVGTVAPNVPETVSFVGTVAATATTGVTYVNTARLSADNAATTTTTPATVLAGTANVVYDGDLGGSVPIAGALVQLIDPRTGRALTLPQPGQAPNTKNADPYVTGPDGTYSFGLGTAQFSGTYDLLLSAPGYLNRKIQITLTPDTTGTLYNVTVTSLDGQPLATAGGFSTTTGPVSLANLFGFFGNLPLFEAHPVTITKGSDRSFAAAGDRIVWTLNYADTSPAPFGRTTVTDTLPPGMVYAPGTGRVDGAAVEPAVAGRVITWTFPSLIGQHTIVYASVILPGTEAGSFLQNDVTIAAGIPNEPGAFASASANADVQVTSGIFDARTIITGRVYVDIANTGHVARGDVWLPNVRVFLEDGESVVTDINGRYSFPGVRPGMHVLRIDPTTLPPGVYPFDDHAYDSERSTRRLVHHIYDSGLIEDINFALAGSIQP